MGIKRVAGLARNQLLMRAVNDTGEGTSDMDKRSSVVDRMHMELGGKLLSSLRSEIQVLKRLQSASRHE
jgi:hypothetical protein